MRLVVLNMLYSYNNNDNDKDINRPGGGAVGVFST